MNARRSWLAHVALKEVLLLGIAAIAAALFYNHEVLYFDGSAPRPTDPAAYVVLTTILYLLLQVARLAFSFRGPKVRGDLILCPECGQPLDDGTPKGVEAHHEAVLTPRPTEKEVLAAVALRKAIDDARVAAQRSAAVRANVPELLGQIENPPVDLTDIPDAGRPLVIRRVVRGPPGPPKPPTR